MRPRQELLQGLRDQADSVRPDATAYVRTRSMSGTGSLTVNTAAGAGTATCPDRLARCT